MGNFSERGQFTLAPREAVYFIDCDAMRIHGVSALPQVETPGWNTPAGEELATVYSDTYKLGLLALRLLTGDQDTTNPDHLPATTPGLLRQIITDTLTKPATQRPLPEAWSYVLGNAIEHAQHQQKTPPPASATLPPPPIPTVHSRPPAHSAPPVRHSAPPPPQPRPAEGPPAAQPRPADDGLLPGWAYAPAWWLRQRKEVKRAIIAAIVVILAAAGMTGYLLRPHSPASQTPTAQPAPTPVQTSRVSCGGKRTLIGSGSTAQANAMTRFINAFKQACPGQTLNYAANGSGYGIRDFIGGQTDFGGSDTPLSGDQYAAAKARCGGADAWNLPVVFGPIVITYNVNGVSSLNLDGPTAAKIFNGGITVWNDPAIQALNLGVSLPAEPIRVVFRSDASGFTDNFQKYLDAESNGAWGKGAGKSFNGGVGEGATGNNGTSAVIKATEGSITYNEWSFAQAQNLNTAKIVTPAGPDPVAISNDSVGKTISGATVAGQGNDLVLDTASFYKPAQPGAYPIVLVTIRSSAPITPIPRSVQPSEPSCRPPSARPSKAV